LDGEAGGEPATGVFFDEPTPEALIDAILRFEAHTFDGEALVAASRAFGRARFLERMLEVERELCTSELAARRGVQPTRA
jgi:hypothetical protein